MWGQRGWGKTLTLPFFAIMVYSEKMLNTIALMKCEDHHTKKLIQVLPYNCLYLNKGNNSSVKEWILTKLIGY